MSGQAVADGLLVACLCAEWCGACRTFRTELEAVARQRPAARFVWIDIEDHPEVLGDEDIVTFPTVLIAVGTSVSFFGPIEPRRSTLQALVDQATDAAGGSATAPVGLTDIADRVRAFASHGAAV